MKKDGKIDLNQDLTVVLERSDERQSHPVFAISLVNTDGLAFKVYVALEDIKNHLKINQLDTVITSLNQTTNYIKKYLSVYLKVLASENICNLHCNNVILKMESITVNSKMYFYFRGFSLFKFKFLICDEFVGYISRLLQDAEANYARNNYLIFNCKFYYPIIVGKSILKLAEIQSLKAGDIILLDEKYNQNELAVTWKGGPHVSLTTKDPKQ